MVYLTMYTHDTSHYSPLNSQITDSIVDINVKCKYSLIADYAASQTELTRGGGYGTL